MSQEAADRDHVGKRPKKRVRTGFSTWTPVRTNRQIGRGPGEGDVRRVWASTLQIAAHIAPAPMEKSREGQCKESPLVEGGVNCRDLPRQAGIIHFLKSRGLQRSGIHEGAFRVPEESGREEGRGERN